MSPMSGVTRASAAARPPPLMLDLDDGIAHFLADVDQVAASPRMPLVHDPLLAGGGVAKRPLDPAALSYLNDGSGVFEVEPGSAVSESSFSYPSPSSALPSPLHGQRGDGGDSTAGPQGSLLGTPIASTAELGVDHLFLAATSPFDPVNAYPGVGGGPPHGGGSGSLVDGVPRAGAVPDAAVRDLEEVLATDGGGADARAMVMDDGWAYGASPPRTDGPLRSTRGAGARNGGVVGAAGCAGRTLLDELSPVLVPAFRGGLGGAVLPPLGAPLLSGGGGGGSAQAMEAVAVAEAVSATPTAITPRPAAGSPAGDAAAAAAAAAFEVSPHFERFLDAATSTEPTFFNVLTMADLPTGGGSAGGGGGGGGGVPIPAAAAGGGPPSAASSLCEQLQRACVLPGMDSIQLPPSMAAQSSSPSGGASPCLAPPPATPCGSTGGDGCDDGRGGGGRHDGEADGHMDGALATLPPPLSSLAGTPKREGGVPASVSRRRAPPPRAAAAVVGDDPPFLPCSLCTSVFRKQHNLSKHIRSVHLRKRPHVCDMCDAAFGERNKLVKHQLTVHEKQRNYFCEMCTLKFGQASDLKRHVNIVHKGHRPFSCTDCIGRAFGRKASLKQHFISMHRHKAGSPELKAALDRASQMAVAAMAASAAAEKARAQSNEEIDDDGDEGGSGVTGSVGGLAVGAGGIGGGGGASASPTRWTPLHSRDGRLLGMSLGSGGGVGGVAGPIIPPGVGAVNVSPAAAAAAAASAAAASSSFPADPYGGVDTLAVPDDHARRLRSAAAAAAAAAVRLPRR